MKKNNHIKICDKEGHNFYVVTQWTEPHNAWGQPIVEEGEIKNEESFIRKKNYAFIVCLRCGEARIVCGQESI